LKQEHILDEELRKVVGYGPCLKRRNVPNSC